MLGKVPQSALFLFLGYTLSRAGQLVSVPLSLPAESKKMPPPALAASELNIRQNGIRQTLVRLRRSACESDSAQSAGKLVLLLDSGHFLPGTNNGVPRANDMAEAIKKSASHTLRKLPDGSGMSLYSSDGELLVIHDAAKLAIQQPTAAGPLSDRDIKVAVSIFNRPRSSNGVALVKYDRSGKIARRELVKISSSRRNSGALQVNNMALFEVAQLESIASHFADVPGRKALIWFCDERSMSPPSHESPLYLPWLSALAALQRSKMSVYPVHCLTGAPIDRRAPPRSEPQQDEGFVPPAKAISQGIAFLADVTGGRFYEGYADLARAVRQAQADLDCYWDLEWDYQGPDGIPLQQISITSSAAQYKWTYPHARINIAPALSQSLGDRLNAAERGLLTPLAARAIVVRAGAQREANGSLRIAISIDPHSLAPSGPSSEERPASLDIIYAFYLASMHRLDETNWSNARVDLGPTRGVSPETSNEPYVVVKKLRPVSGASSLRILVRNSATGAMGSTTVTL